jgi:hypothetical protein
VSSKSVTVELFRKNYKNIFLPKNRTKYHWTCESYVWDVAENFARSGFDPWTVQPLASCDTDCAIPAVWSSNRRKKPLGRPRRRWEDNIKTDVQGVGWGDMDWIDLVQDRDRKRTLVNAVMKLRVP